MHSDSMFKSTKSYIKGRKNFKKWDKELIKVSGISNVLKSELTFTCKCHCDGLTCHTSTAHVKEMVGFYRIRGL